jgi:hypothetical protein
MAGGFDAQGRVRIKTWDQFMWLTPTALDRMVDDRMIGVSMDWVRKTTGTAPSAFDERGLMNAVKLVAA